MNLSIAGLPFVLRLQWHLPGSSEGVAMEGLGLALLILICRFVPFLPIAFIVFWIIFGLLYLAMAEILLKIVFKIIEIIEKRGKKK